ncbi:MAG: glycosyltransferase family 4 protein, partial [Candidatus Rokuibacteriota bacterium]
PREGGIERRMVALGSEFRRAGHQVIVVASRFDGAPRREEVAGLDVFRVDARPAVPYDPPSVLVRGGGRAVAGAVLRARPDVVDFQYRWSPAFTLGMERVMRAGIPATFTFHNVFGEGRGILRPFSYLNDSMMKLHISKYDRITCVSDFVRRDLVARGFPSPKIRVCHNALDPPPRGADDAATAGGFGLFVGRLIRTKGLEHMLRALALLRDATGAELPFVIAGDGPRRDRLAALAARLGLERVRFAGRVSESEKWSLLRSCSVFVMPSIAESFGVALLEAMSAGRPVIASRVGGMPEVVAGAGVLVPPGDPAALAGALCTIVADRPLAIRLGAAASERALMFSWRDAARTMLSIYQEAIVANEVRRHAAADYRPAGSGLAARTADARTVGIEPFRSDS